MLRAVPTPTKRATKSAKADIVPLANQGIRDFIKRQIGIYAKSCAQVANDLGGDWKARHVEQILFQEMSKSEDLAYRRGYRDGRLSLVPPPTAPARRAA